MSAIQRRHSIFDIISKYIEEFETLADEFVESTIAERPGWDTESCCLKPLCNVFVTPEHVLVTADLPNSEQGSVKVEALDANIIEITSKMKRKMRFKISASPIGKGSSRLFVAERAYLCKLTPNR